MNTKRKPKPWKGDKWKNPYLMNWPPSRGPMPPWMRRKTRFLIEEPSRVDGPPPRRLTREEMEARKERARKFREQMEATAAQRAKSRRKGKKARGALAFDLRTGSFKRQTAAQLAKIPDGRPGSFRTNIHVATLAELTAEQATRIVYMEEKDVGKQPEEPKSFYKNDGKADRWRKMVYWKWSKKQLRFPMRSAIRTRINYPLARWVEITVPPYKFDHRRRRLRNAAARDRYATPHMSEGYFLWALAREYVRIYRQHRKYGIWGHAIGDLYFEGIRLLPKKRAKDMWEAELWIGS